MFGILADSMITAVFGNRTYHRGDWPRSELRYRPEAETDPELKKKLWQEYENYKKGSGL